MKLLKMTLENFRGCREATYDFSDLTRIKGRNGSGKSTIFSAYLWVLADRDSTMVANPPVRTIGAIDEQVTSVTIDVLIADKPVQIQKSQKLKRSKSGIVSLTNSYMVNSVPKSEKAFREYLEELGFDFDKFLPCSHPGVLLAGINNKKERTALRNLLFQMASDITDLEVCEGDPELFGLIELLEDYKVEEIEAMQNNVLRQIRENYGKDGEILRAKIEGLESAKVIVDEKSHKSEIKKLEKKASGIEESYGSLMDSMEKAKNAQAEVMEKKFRLNELERAASHDVFDKKSKINKDMLMLDRQIMNLEREKTKLDFFIKDCKKSVKEDTDKNQWNYEKLKRIESEKFDSKSTICPTCGQKYPAEKIAEMKERFENGRKKNVDNFMTAIKTVEDRIKETKVSVQDMEFKISEKNKEIKAHEKARSELSDMMNDLSEETIDISDNKEYQKVLSELKEVESVAGTVNDIQTQIDSALEKLSSIKDEIASHRKELDKLEQNKRIDSQIQEAREAQANYEQQKANAEMILDQLKTLNMKKNEMLQESVNGNFNLITWRLFIQQKNGEFKDACIPMIGDKAFGESMNTGLETMAKIDAMNGIQKFFGLDYPIWLDNAEHLDKWSLERLSTDHQLIVLTVTDDERLVIE